MSYNTGNPVEPSGSSDPRDLFDNSANLDKAVNGDAPTWLDRKNRTRKSLAGMELEFESSQSDKEVRFRHLLLSSGYENIGNYAAGLQLTELNQVFLKDGELYRTAPSTELPYTTNGVWSSESSKFVSVGDAALRQEIAQPPGSRMIGHLLGEPSTYSRLLGDKLDELPSVKDFGPPGTGNGVTSDHLAAIRMGQALGYIRFSRGSYVLDTCQFDWPVFYDKKASTRVSSGGVVTITQAVSSPKQYIFKGEGQYNLTQIEGGSGEDVRYVHASWFGAFPSVVNAGDQAPAISRGFASMGNARESVMEFDIGGYVMSSQATITRGGWVKGAGSRRTVFKFNADGYIGFIDTVSGLAKITDCNFELIPGTVTNRVYPFIQFAGNECEIYNIRLGETFKGIVVTGNSPRIYNIAAAYGSDKGSGSDLIHIKGGNAAVVDKINLATSSAFGPEMIVRVGGAGNLGINYASIRNIFHMTPSISVGVEAFNLNISGVIIDGVQYHGFAGAAPAQMIKLETSGTAGIENVNIDKIQGSSRSIAMVTLRQNSSTFMRRVAINGVQDKRVDGNGVELIRTAGVLEHVDIGSGVQMKSRTNPVYRSGVLGEIRVAPGVERDSSVYLSRASNIPDDQVLAIDLGKSVVSALVKLSSVASSTINYGDYAIRAAPSPFLAVINQSSGMATALTALNGTTGADGKITMGVTDGVLYIENRSGVAINVAVGVTGA